MKTVKNNAFFLMLSIFCIPIGAMENGGGNDKEIMINENDNVTYSQEELDKRLVEAVRKGHKTLAQWCLDKGANINAKNNTGQSVLHIACFAHVACWAENIEILKLLLACNGIEINAKDDCEKTPLHIACQHTKTEVVKLLLACNGIEINAKDDCEKTPLHVACRFDENKEIVELLLACNGIEINAKDDCEKTPLHIACQHKNKEIVELLLACHGIDINVKDKNGQTALHLVCWHGGSTDIVKLLVENGINILARDNSGRTALNIAFNNDIRTYLANVENQLTSYIDNPFALTPCLSNTQLTKIIYNLGKADISYKALMYWFSKMYLNPKFMNIGQKLDACEFNEFNKNDKSLMVNAHNFLNSSKELIFYENLMREKEPYAEFDLKFIYKSFK